MSVFGQSQPCEVLKTDRSYYAYFPHSHARTLRSADNSIVSRTIRNNNLYVHLISYKNGDYGNAEKYGSYGNYGSYVSFNEQLQETVKENKTLVAVKSGYVDCVSSSYKPKELSRMWVKGVKDPFEFVNTTSKTLNGSVTLKCKYKSCWSFNAHTNEYGSDCPFDFVVPPSLSLKFTLTISLLPLEQYSSSTCAYTNGYRNGTHDCSDTSVYSSLYYYKPLNTTVDHFRARVFSSKDNTSTIYRTVMKPQYANGAYSQYSDYTHYYSLCGESCTVLPVDD
jgi:hypothetical protein